MEVYQSTIFDLFSVHELLRKVNTKVDWNKRNAYGWSYTLNLERESLICASCLTLTMPYPWLFYLTLTRSAIPTLYWTHYWKIWQDFVKLFSIDCSAKYAHVYTSFLLTEEWNRKTNVKLCEQGNLWIFPISSLQFLVINIVFMLNAQVHICYSHSIEKNKPIEIEHNLIS